MRSPGDLRTDLKQYALFLRNGDPVTWEAFVKSFEAYTQEVLENVAQAPADEVLRMQGRARQCLALLQIFKDCASPSRGKPAPQ